jgi:DNA-binding LacI/PurR family transcriptional regulator
MNRSRGADSIPQETKECIFAAARKLNYRPNFMARSLRKQRSFTIGVMVPEVSEGYAALVMSGIEDHLLQEGYFYFVASHRHKSDLIEEYPALLLERSVEGMIAVDTPLGHDLPIPVVTVSGHREIKGVINITLDHQKAADLALQHLVELGHSRIAFIKGQVFSSDTEIRWKAICDVARKKGVNLDPRLTAQLEGDLPSPEVGTVVMRKLLAANQPFTALFAFNDISAIGAISVLRQAGLRVPDDVSVIGFDDIQSAAYQNPPLTTVRQPLRKMGTIAAETLLRRITGNGSASSPIIIQPELVVRGTTAPVSRK